MYTHPPRVGLFTHVLTSDYEKLELKNKQLRAALESIIKKSFLTSLDPVVLATQMIEMVADAKAAIDWKSGE